MYLVRHSQAHTSSISLGWPKLARLYPDKRHPRPVDGLMYFTVLELSLTLSHQQLFAIHPCSKLRQSTPIGFLQ